MAGFTTIYIMLGFMWLILLADIIVLWLVHKSSKRNIEKIKSKIRDLDIDTKISGMLSEKGGEDKSLHELANDLLKHVNTKYGLNARSYSEAVQAVSKINNIDDTLRDSLIDFFEHLIVISYKKEEGPHFEHEKDYLRDKLRVIVKLMEDAE